MRDFWEGWGLRVVAEPNCDIYCAHPSQGLLQSLNMHTAQRANQLLLCMRAALSHGAQCAASNLFGLHFHFVYLFYFFLFVFLRIYVDFSEINSKKNC